VKVHVTLEKSVVSDPVARLLTFYRVVGVGRMVPANPARLARHGIITGEMPAERVELVRGVEGVEAIEADDEEVHGGDSPCNP
jgi:hypothetical protein